MSRHASLFCCQFSLMIFQVYLALSHGMICGFDVEMLIVLSMSGNFRRGIKRFFFSANGSDFHRPPDEKLDPFACSALLMAAFSASKLVLTGKIN